VPQAAEAKVGDDLARYRNEFPILEKAVYLISNSLGAMPKGAARGLAEYAEIWATRGVRAWEEAWWELAGVVGDRIGGIIGAPAGSVSMHENVTTAQAVVLSCFEPSRGRHKIVCSALDFPSLIYLYRAQAGYGFELEVVPGEPDLTVSVERLRDAIDETTLLAAVSHVLFQSAFVVDAAPLVEHAREVGAALVLDVYQSAGAVPLDVTALGVDFAVGGCLKWLCGGPGTAFLYTRPDRLPSLRPRLTGWFAHRDPFAFDPGPLQPRSGSGRMMNGTPAVPAYYAARAGLEIVAEAGVEAIREKSLRMTARLLELADRHGFPSAAPRDPRRRGGTVALAVPEALAVARALRARGFLVDYRVGVGIRVAPHFYNTFEELDRLMDEVARIVRYRDYAAPAPADSFVT
jgi:kynureninase